MRLDTRHFSIGLKIDEMEVTVEEKAIVLGLKESECPQAWI